MCKNLFLIISRTGGRYDPGDFEHIGNLVAKKAPDIHVLVVDAKASADQVPEEVWQHPTLTIAFQHMRGFKPRRGHLMFARPIEKLDQADFLNRMGVEVPHSTIYDPGMSLPAEMWGDLVILKPSDLRLTSHGGVTLYRREKLERMRLEDFPAEHLIHKSPMIVQRYVYTGTQPDKYRALTFCGEPLYVQYAILTQAVPNPTASDAEIEAAVVSTGAGERMYYHGDYPEILEFARRAASAFPGRPLLGIDIIKDHKTGKLYVLEVNAGGNVWHFSSRMWAERRRTLPEIGRQMREQLGAFETAANTLIRTTRQMAN